MQLYDTYLDILENIEVSNKTNDEKQALEAAADALSFVQGIHDMFVAQGVAMGEDPDMYRLEGVIEGYVGELVAAVMLLSNYQLGDTPTALEKLNTALQDKLPANVSTGFLRLADRVKKTRVAQQQLIEVQKKLT